jgi:transcriptional regulator with XRE-family HTH domain
MGRPAKHKRAPLGERIAALRKRAGFSQTQLAEKLSLGQQTVAYWERHASTLKPKQISALAETLQATPEEILGMSVPLGRAGRSADKLRQAFERASELPRDQQRHVLRVVEDAITAYEVRKSD